MLQRSDDTMPATEPPHTSVRRATDVPLDDPHFASRYVTQAVLGRGGMGEVQLTRDARIGRDVALKSVRVEINEDASLRERFLREARVQGQLEHPAIVPVYDVGTAPDGSLFFTMKRVRGETLEEIVAALVAGDPDATRRHTRRRLLTAYAQVCLAVHFAHTRGVVHRDLKPSNVMLGDFGEVYVLDWGIARVLADADVRAADAGTAVTTGSGASGTVAGSMMGTPGYMAPEQARDATSATARSDVYSLGAILFELLALEPVHAGDTAADKIASTIVGVDIRARLDRVTDLPPEIVESCARALTLDPRDRYGSALALHDDVERYLDGDRDLARRRDLAATHTDAAQRALDAAPTDVAEEDRRTRAMADAGRALALDPANARAAAIVARLLLDPPRETPREVTEDLRDADRRSVRNASWAGMGFYGAYLAGVPLVLWFGVRQWGLFLAMVGAAFVGLVVNAWLGWRRTLGVVSIVAPPVFAGVVLFATTPIFGPLLLVPQLACGIACALVIVRPGSAKRWWIAPTVCWAAWAVPFALEWAGLLPRFYDFANGTMIVRPHMLRLTEAPTRVLFLVTSVTTMFLPVAFVDRTRAEIVQARRELALRAWQLRNLVPGSAIVNDRR